MVLVLLVLFFRSGGDDGGSCSSGATGIGLNFLLVHLPVPLYIACTLSSTLLVLAVLLLPLTGCLHSLLMLLLISVLLVLCMLLLLCFAAHRVIWCAASDLLLNPGPGYIPPATFKLLNLCSDVNIKSLERAA